MTFCPLRAGPCTAVAGAAAVHRDVVDGAHWRPRAATGPATAHHVEFDHHRPGERALVRIGAPDQHGAPATARWAPSLAVPTQRAIQPRNSGGRPDGSDGPGWQILSASGPPADGPVKPARAFLELADVDQASATALCSRHGVPLRSASDTRTVGAPSNGRWRWCRACPGFQSRPSNLPSFRRGSPQRPSARLDSDPVAEGVRSDQGGRRRYCRLRGSPPKAPPPGHATSRPDPDPGG